ncbi:MAG: hypothetical protein AB1546_02445, partial [bacterium]
MKKMLAMITTVAVLAVLSGCGGGGSGSPAAPSVKAGHGRVAAELHFKRSAADRATGTTATGTISIAITVTGYYGVDDTAFPALTASAEIDAAGGYGTVSM